MKRFYNMFKYSPGTLSPVRGQTPAYSPMRGYTPDIQDFSPPPDR